MTAEKLDLKLLNAIRSWLPNPLPPIKDEAELKELLKTDTALQKMVRAVLRFQADVHKINLHK